HGALGSWRAPMARVDLRKELKPLYQPSAKAIAEVQVPAFTFLMVDGQGDPSHSADYTEAVEALFTVAYAAKFRVKKSPGGCDYAVMPHAVLQSAIDEAGKKKTLPALPRLRIERFEEGRCAQILHEYIAARSRLRGRHHEIYLSDIRRADPSRWKTVIRQPME